MTLRLLYSSLARLFSGSEDAHLLRRCGAVVYVYWSLYTLQARGFTLGSHLCPL
jgi:hypothetical protein